MASAAAPSSFLTLRGVAEDLPSARLNGVWASVIRLRARKAEFARTATHPPSQPAGKRRVDDTTTGMLVPISFDPLVIPEARGEPGTRLGGRHYLQSQPSRRRRQGEHLPPVSSERLDRWIRSSVTEIVKRIQEEAPFLSLIFFVNDDDGNTGGGSTSFSAVRIEREVAEGDGWSSIQKRWGCTVPDGVILVEELMEKPVAVGGRQEEELTKDVSSGIGQGSPATRTWGVLVQGRGGGPDCTACYVINTCRIRSAIGCCTHFCLLRAQCFGDSAEQQLRNTWLAYDGGRPWEQQ